MACNSEVAISFLGQGPQGVLEAIQGRGGVHWDKIEDDVEVAETLVFHIGFMYLSPFKPTFRVVEVFQKEQEPGLMVVKGTPEYLVEAKAYLRFNLDMRWKAHFYVIREELRPLAKIDASIAVCVRAVSAPPDG